MKIEVFEVKALIVDDSKTTRQIMGHALTASNIEQYDEAEDGRVAVALCEVNEYVLVLMDWNMPKMCGLDAVRAIRSIGNKVPIIMVTTEAEKFRIIEALKAGANNYVVKPFTPEVLSAKIKETIIKAMS